MASDDQVAVGDGRERFDQLGECPLPLLLEGRLAGIEQGGRLQLDDHPAFAERDLDRARIDQFLETFEELLVGRQLRPASLLLVAKRADAPI
ncbi:MAG: hypothetical protein ACRBN8_21155 [Nannocystales bacterium]